MSISVFMSHNSADKSFARRLATDLDLAGARVWIDEAEIRLGDSLIGKISEGIQNADYLAVVLSPNSVKSAWVERELEIALNQEISGKKVFALPLLYKTCTIPPFLQGKLYADFREEDNYTSALNLVKERLDLPLTKTDPQQDDETYNEEVLHTVRSGLLHIRQRSERALDKQPENERVERELELIHSLTQKPLVVLGQLRALNSFGRGEYQLMTDRECDVDSILRRIIIGLKPWASHREIKFSLSERSSRFTNLHADGGLLEIAFYNMLENTLNYSFKETTVEVSIVRVADYLQVDIINIGIKIKDSERKKIFELGYRSREAIEVTAGGTGRGLHFANQVVSAHGGSIAYLPGQKKHANIFRVQLPLKY